MFLFKTTFDFDDVLRMQPGQDNTVSHELIDLAWDLWAKVQPATFQEHDESAYATIEAGQMGYIVTIQTAVMCDRDTYMLYGRYLHSQQTEKEG